MQVCFVKTALHREMQSLLSNLNRLLRSFLTCFFAATLAAQPLQERYSGIGEVVLLSLSTAPFPDALRDSGHTYGGITFSAREHYQDSTVGVFIPKGYRKDRPLDIVVHIHGWYNSVDSVFAQFKLAEQLFESRKNAILVIPQGPKNAPDSYGGKLEQTDAFRRLMTDVTGKLHKQGKVGTKDIRTIIISGHSGAYRMISFILMRGGLTEKVKEVYLFDALYGNVEKYAYWVDHSRGRLVAIYTDSGGTRGTTEGFMEDLSAWKIPFANVEESGSVDSRSTWSGKPLPALTPRDLRTHRVVFIHTDVQHNDVLSARQEFRSYLESGTLEER